MMLWYDSAESIIFHSSSMTQQPCHVSQDGVPASSLQSWLATNNINVSVSAITSNRTLFEAAGLQAVVRASVHVYNTEEELDKLVEAVQSVPEQRSCA